MERTAGVEGDALLGSRGGLEKGLWRKGSDGIVYESVTEDDESVGTMIPLGEDRGLSGKTFESGQTSETEGREGSFTSSPSLDALVEVLEEGKEEREEGEEEREEGEEENDGSEDSFDTVAYEEEERRLKKIYEENIDLAILDIERGNFFLGYDNVADGEQFLTNKNFLQKRKIQLVPYQKIWGEDMFVLGHNTIKTEMLDLYKIVSAMEKRGLKALKETVSHFYDWWALFLNMLTVVLDMEEDVLYAWIEKKVDLTGTRMTKSERAVVRNKLAQLLDTIRIQEQKMFYIPPGEVAPKLLSFLNQFCPLLLSYMNRSTYVVATKVKQIYTPDEYENELVPCMARYLHEQTQWRAIAVLMTRWMERSQLQSFKRDFLTTGEKLKFGLWNRHVDRTHYELREAIIEERQLRKTLYQSWSK